MLKEPSTGRLKREAVPSGEEDDDFEEFTSPALPPKAGSSAFHDITNGRMRK